ncbi:hypothetical protein Q5M57_01020 [Acinetobacter baumannii]|nr:hypothetical protein [Acinetobacter baumannii]
MTDLNKEREICDQYFEKYWDDFCEAYGNGFDRSLAKLFFANGWGEAKAQTVPETHIVVPKQPTPKMIDTTWDFDDEIIEMSSNTRNEFIWKKMVEASESGAEG